MAKVSKKKKKLQLIKELKRRPLTLRLYPDSILREKAEPVQFFNTVLQDFANDMLFFMQQYDGIGIAASQVGILQRIVVVDIGKNPLCLVNPEIVSSSCSANMIEGCLSFPGYEIDVNRNTWIEIQCRNLKGERFVYEVEGLIARVLQHEVDHLNGILICDYGELLPDHQDLQFVDSENEHNA